jgi:inward rectifier potassium channel
MHVIDESSPLADATADSLSSMDATFSLTMSGTDETTGQVLIGRAEYPSHAIQWNHSFRDVLEPDADGAMTYDYSRFHEVIPLEAHHKPVRHPEARA